MWKYIFLDALRRRWPLGTANWRPVGLAAVADVIGAVPEDTSADLTADLCPADDGRVTRLDEVRQGQIQDCWLVSAASAVAHFDPRWVERHIRPVPQTDTFKVTVYRRGRPTTVSVDANLPVSAQGQWLGAVSDLTGQPNWLSIYEKAVAVHLGRGRVNYALLDVDLADRGLRIATGGTSWPLGTRNLARLQRRLERGPVLLSSKAPQRHLLPSWLKAHAWDVVPAHVYIVEAVGMDAGELRCRVVNPWGSGFGESGRAGASYVPVNGRPPRVLTLNQAEVNRNFMASQWVRIDRT